MHAKSAIPSVAVFLVSLGAQASGAIFGIQWLLYAGFGGVALGWWWFLARSSAAESVWKWGAYGIKRMGVIAATALVTGALGAGMAWVFTRAQQKIAEQSKGQAANKPTHPAVAKDAMIQRPNRSPNTQEEPTVKKPNKKKSENAQRQTPVAPPAAAGISVDTNQGIITQNQSGGSNVVNLGSPSRKFTDVQEVAFRQVLKSANATNGEIIISCQGMGSTEPCDFGRYIAGVLRDVGWKVNFAGPVIAWGDPKKKMAALALTVNPGSIPPYARPLQGAFAAAGIEATGFKRSDATPNSLEMFINVQESK